MYKCGIKPEAKIVIVRRMKTNTEISGSVIYLHSSVSDPGFGPEKVYQVETEGDCELWR